MRRPSALLPGLFLALLCASPGRAVETQNAQQREPVRVALSRREEPLVEIAKSCSGVVVELRYSGERNITGKPIYPAGARALVRRSVAERLNRAQKLVSERGFSLKIWDAYRPPWVQQVLWDAVKNPAYVCAPTDTGSLHSWGAAVDVTLVDFRGREVRMPTDFDSFSPAAQYDYRGRDPEIIFNLNVLKMAMNAAGFRHISDEWWHYSAEDALVFSLVDLPLTPEEKTSRVALPKVAEAPPGAAEPAPIAELPKPRPARPARRPLFPERASESL